LKPVPANYQFATHQAVLRRDWAECDKVQVANQNPLSSFLSPMPRGRAEVSTQFPNLLLWKERPYERHAYASLRARTSLQRAACGAAGGMRPPAATLASRKSPQTASPPPVVVGIAAPRQSWRHCPACPRQVSSTALANRVLQTLDEGEMRLHR